MRRVKSASVAVMVTVFLTSCGAANVAGPSDTPVNKESTPAAVPGGGNFELTFLADRSCASLPEEARARSYTATLPQGVSLARLGGATFPDGGPYGLWNAVAVRIVDESMDVWSQDPPIWESLSDGAYLVIYGDAHGRLAGDRATIPFWGRFEYCRHREPDDYPECAVPLTTCESPAHQLIVQRKF